MTKKQPIHLQIICAPFSPIYSGRVKQPLLPEHIT